MRCWGVIVKSHLASLVSKNQTIVKQTAVCALGDYNH